MQFPSNYGLAPMQIGPWNKPRANQPIPDYSKGLVSSPMERYAANVRGRDQARAMVQSITPITQLAPQAAQQFPYQAQTPWVGSNAYNNVSLPATALGPNQSMPAVRDRLANQFDPNSWRTMTSTPTEEQQRVNSLTAGVRSRNALASRGDAYSPVYGLGVQNQINAAYGARKDAQDAAYDARWNRAQQLQADTNAQFQAMGLNPQQARNDNAEIGAQYANYAANSRRAGVMPMDYRTWSDNGGASNPESAALKQAAFQNRMAQRGQPRQQVYNPLAAAMMSHFTGMPMALSTGPQSRDMMIENMAASGNPMAYGMRNQDVFQAGETARAGMEQYGLNSREVMAQQGQNYRTGMLDAGANYRAGLQFSPKPFGPEEGGQAIATLQSLHPDRVYREAVQSATDQLRGMQWTDEQIKSPDGQKYIRSQAERARQDAIQPYNAMVSMYSRGLPTGAVLPYSQATVPQPPSAGQAAGSGQASLEESLGLATPKAPDTQAPDKLSFAPATPYEVARILENNPDISPDMLEATLASEGKTVPPANTLQDIYTGYGLSNGAYDPSKAKTPEYRKRQGAVNSFFGKHYSRYGMKSPQEFQQSQRRPAPYVMTPLFY